MQVEEELARHRPGKDSLLAIGVFDGVHLGHRYLLSQLRESAQREALLAGVVTFRQHPLEVLSPGEGPPHLTEVAERTCLLEKVGADFVVALTFTHELAGLSAREFVLLLKEHLRMRGLVIGPDFAMGRGREGNAASLSRLGEELGFSVIVIPPKVVGEVVSSTAIRSALAEGDIERVTGLLGRRFAVSGVVTTGTGRGAGLGFPTANLDVDAKQALPPEGVYATWAYGEGEAHQAMTNIGRNPTFGENERTVEVLLLDFRGDLYGRRVRVEFVQRLRDEKKFDSVDDLKRQIAQDVEQGRAILSTRGCTAP